MSNRSEEALAIKVANEFGNLKFSPDLFNAHFKNNAPIPVRETMVWAGMASLYAIYQQLKTNEEFPLTCPNPYSKKITDMAYSWFEEKA